MAKQDRLKTKQRLKMMNLCDDDACLLCNKGPENLKHLFFNFHFTKKCIEETMR